MSTASAPTSAPSPLQPGTVVAAKYRVERVLGQGGMGMVVAAHHMTLDERVALKVLLPELAKQTDASARFLREARNAVKIKSEHVARVADVGMLDSGAPYMVMELLEGRDLSETLQATGVLQLPDAIDYVIQACEAIAEAHSLGIIHRDLKPANLFLSKRRDGSPIVKVLDFGISKSGASVDNLTKTNAVSGSLLYMSPEQMRQGRDLDHRTDIYSLGVSLFELLAGRQPFYATAIGQLCSDVLSGEPTPLRSLRADLPEAFADVLRRAYAREAKDRYQTIGELVAALAPWAPPRSATTIERIARMSGTPVPEVPASSSGVFATTSAPIPDPPPTSKSGTYPTPRSGGVPAVPPQSSASTNGTTGAPAPSSANGFTPAPPTPVSAPITAVSAKTQPVSPPSSLLGTRPTVPLPEAGAAPAQPPPPAPPPPPLNPNQILPGPYSAPMSVRAAATFRHGASRPPPIVGQPRSRASLIVALAVSMLGIGGIGTALVLKVVRQPGTPVPDPEPPVVTSVTSASANVPASAAPPTVTPAPPVETAKPDESARPVDSARPADSAHPHDVAPGTSAKSPLPRAPGTRPSAPHPDKKNDGNKPHVPDLGKMY